jgi:RNA polymerase sigma factor (sigma-70 family)
MYLKEDEVRPILLHWSRRFARAFPRQEAHELYNIAYIGKIQNVKRIDHASTVIRCDILDYLRYFKRRDAFEKLPTDLCAEERECHVSEVREFIDKIMSNVKPDLREKTIIFLIYYKGYTFQQVADTLGLSKSGISTIHAKILKKLQENSRCILKHDRSLTLAM